MLYIVHLLKLANRVVDKGMKPRQTCSSSHEDDVKNRYIVRLGKLACPRVNDDQKIDVGDQNLNSGRPHDY